MTEDFYNSYRSTQWQEKKNKILTRDNYTCAICGKHGDENTLMHVHHLTYKNCKDGKAWNCPDEDLVTLCEDCHKKIHSKEPYKKASDNFTYYKSLYNQFNDIKKGDIVIYYDEVGVYRHAFLSQSPSVTEESGVRGLDFRDGFAVDFPISLRATSEGIVRSNAEIAGGIDIVEVISSNFLLSKVLRYIARQAGWDSMSIPSGEQCEDDISTACYFLGIPLKDVELYHALFYVLSITSFKKSESAMMADTIFRRKDLEDQFNKLSINTKLAIAVKAVALDKAIKDWWI